MVKKVILLVTFFVITIIPHVEATPSTAHMTKAMVLSGEGPYKKVEVIQVKDGYRIDMIIKPINPEETITFVAGYSGEFNNDREFKDFINVESQHEFKVSFLVNKEDLEKLLYYAITTPKIFVDGGVAYFIDNIRDFIKKE